VHCVHIRSLPVSAIARISKGGVPRDKLMRYSPPLAIISDSTSFGETVAAVL
jgi:hypothetical protein